MNFRNYRKFRTIEEANAWGEKFYPDGVFDIDFKDIHRINEIFSREQQAIFDYLLDFYNKNFYNIYLRSGKILEDDIPQKVRILTKYLNNKSLPEPILAYHFYEKVKTDINGNKITVGSIILGKDFCSTSLIPKEIKGEMRGRGVLKIYIHAETKGSYLQFKQGKNECEFLLPPNIKLKVIGRQFDFRIFKIVFLCEIIK